MVRCLWPGTEYDERRVGREHAMLEPNGCTAFARNATGLSRSCGIRLPSTDRYSICTGWSLSISTIPIDWGKRACSSTHDFDGSSRNCCACVPREVSLDRLGMPRARQRTYPCFQGKLNAQFQVEGQSKFSYPIACKFRNGFLAYGFNWELFTIDQFLCVENAIVQCQIDPLPGDERA
jgi:hypothetical protein